jgi:hypothetical protein
MRRMIEMIKQSAIPANMMGTAAKGALSVAPAEMVEILVYLSTHPIFGNEARLTLAGFDQKVAKEVCADPRTSSDVLSYFVSADNLRLPLLSSLLENPSVSEDMVTRLAMQASSRVLANMLWHPRVLNSKSTLHAISMNMSLPEEDGVVVRSALANLGENTEYLIEQAQLDAEANELSVPNEILDAELDRYVRDHADEIAADEDKPFDLYVHTAPSQPAESPETSGAVVGGAGEVPKLVAFATVTPERTEDGAVPDPSLKKKVSAFQKISKLGVGQRVQLAIKGSKDERFILVRDGSKVVCVAVLESPKITDQEVEMFATLKNVQEGVLRGIAGQRKFMRNYAVQRNLACNPRTPLDVSLPIMKSLMINDLRSMSKNKNINDTLRKTAVKLYKQRSEKKSE